MFQYEASNQAEAVLTLEGFAAKFDVGMSWSGASPDTLSAETAELLRTTSMPIAVTCQACGQSFQLRDDMAGRTVRCRCGGALVVPDPAAGALPGILDDELSKPYERPAEREAPEFVLGKESAVKKATEGGPTWAAPPEDAELVEVSNFGPQMRVALRSIIGVVGLGYGLVMLGFGVLMILLAILIFRNHGSDGVAIFPWAPAFLLVMIGICGLLLAVSSVGVLIARKAAGIKTRFAAGILVVLWIALAGLKTIMMLRNRLDENTQLGDWKWDFWEPVVTNFAAECSWAIVPLLVYLWCRFMSKHVLTYEQPSRSASK